MSSQITLDPTKKKIIFICFSYIYSELFTENNLISKFMAWKLMCMNTSDAGV